MVNEPWNRIIKKWHDDDIPIRAGVLPKDIALFESKYQVVLPHDVREYFMTVDGTGDHMTEKWCFRFWPIAHVMPLREELDPRLSDQWLFPDCFVFADHLCSSWIYALKLTQDPNQSAPVFQVHCGKFPHGAAICDSFREFMSHYADDDTNIIL